MNNIPRLLILLAIVLIVLQSFTSTEIIESTRKTESNTRLKVAIIKPSSEHHVAKETYNPNLPLSAPCHCNAIVYLTKTPTKGIPLYHKDKSIVKRFSFNEDSEEYAAITLKNYSKTMFQVESITLPLSTENIKSDDYLDLWIDKTDLRIYLPDADVQVNIYAEPDQHSTVIGRVSAYGEYTLQPLKCCKKWIYAIYHNTKTNTKIEGWFHPDDTCSNPLTSC